MNLSKIDEFRKLHGLSRTDLEAAAGLSNGALGKWERSAYGPSITQLMKVANYFRVPVDALLVREEKNHKRGNQMSDIMQNGEKR